MRNECDADPFSAVKSRRWRHGERSVRAATYIYNKGDGIDQIWDNGTGDEASILVFGNGVSKDSVVLHKGSLLLDLGIGDGIHIENFDYLNPMSNVAFSSFQFGDGSSLGWGELLARGFDIDGTEADDSLTGTGVDDRMRGFAGNDLLYGLAGNDTLDGGAGINGLAGGLGDDSYIVSIGEAQPDLPNGLVETIIEEGGSDTLRLVGRTRAEASLFLADDVDTLIVETETDRIQIESLAGGSEGAIDYVEFNGSGNSVERVALADLTVEGRTLSNAQDGAILTGTWADDTLTASGQGATINGGAGRDLIQITGDGATINGGAGNDSISALGGNNTILYRVGDGSDRAATSASANPGNVLKLSGVTANQVTVGLGPMRELEIRVGSDAKDAIRFASFDAADPLASRAFDHIDFDDGATLSYDALLARGFNIAGSTGNDRLVGTGGDDRFLGGAGNDILSGGAGNDTYVYNSGDGQDTVIDLVGSNAIEFGAGLTRSAMTVTQGIGIDGARSLNLDFGNSERLSIQQGEQDKVQTFRFADGTTLTTADLLASLPGVQLAGDATANTLQGYGGDDALSGMDGDDTLTGGAGNDLLDGGAGNDILRGGAGTDSYRLGWGSGHDQIDEAASETSIIRLEEDVLIDDLHAVKSGADIVLKLRVSGDSIRLADHADSTVQLLQADGTSMSLADFMARPALTGDAVVRLVKSRRWRDGERGLRAANNETWRRTA